MQGPIYILEPVDPKIIEDMIKIANSRAGPTYPSLLSALNRDSSDTFLLHLKVNLQKLEKRSQEIKAAFPAGAVLNAISCYHQLVQLYFTKADLHLLESSVEFTEMIETHDLRKCQGFECLFAAFSVPVPRPFLQAFCTNVDLAIACWSALAWPERERLTAGFLIQEIFNTLDTIKVDKCMFSWRPAPECCPCVIAEGEFQTDVRHFISSITRSSNSLLGFDEEKWMEREPSVASMCMQAWKRKSFADGDLPKLPCSRRSLLSLLQGTTIEAFRGVYMEQLTQGKESPPIMGGKEILGQVLQHDPFLHCADTAGGLIRKVRAFINRHQPMDTVSVVPATCRSSNLFLSQFLTLADGFWVSTEVLDFAFSEYALLTRACCNLFPAPLCGSSRPRIFYCDTSIFTDIIPKDKPWSYDIHNYDYLYIPAFVDHSHYIGLAVTITGSTGHLNSLDSLGCSRLTERNLVVAWLGRKFPDILWTHSAALCPSQTGNTVDCAILTFLCGTYFHLVPAKRNLTDFYSLKDVALVRKQLVLLAINVGNEVRSSTPWAPFINDLPEGGAVAPRLAEGARPGSPTTTGREAGAGSPTRPGRGGLSGPTTTGRGGRPGSPTTTGREAGAGSPTRPGRGGLSGPTTTGRGGRPGSPTTTGRGGATLRPSQ